MVGLLQHVHLRETMTPIKEMTVGAVVVFVGEVDSKNDVRYGLSCLPADSRQIVSRGIIEGGFHRLKSVNAFKFWFNGVWHEGFDNQSRMQFQHIARRLWT
jgi:hypothetical protein